MPAKSGFTLIEILVVLVIIGITIGFALLAFGDFGGSRRVVTAAESFANQIKLIQQQAILESATYGIQIEPTQYKVLKFKPPAHWENATAPFLGRVHTFPNSAVMRFDNTSTQKKPSIIIYSTGDMTTFRFIFGTTKKPNLIRLIGESNGNITIDSDIAL